MSRDNDLLRGPYSTADLARAAGVTKNVIADWLVRDVITDTVPPGRGKDRAFTLWNVVEAVVASHLMRLKVKSGTYATVLSIAKSEAFRLNTYTKRNDGLDDFVIVVRVDPDGAPNSIYREGPAHRQPGWRDDEATILSLRIDVGLAISHARRTLQA